MAKSYFLFPLFLMLSVSATAEEVAKAYEMVVYHDSGIQDGGLPLAYPGDRYRYTFVIDDEFSRDPNRYIKNAIVGIHIIDDDWQAEVGDTAPEWGTILIDGIAQKWVKPPHLTAYHYHQADEPALSLAMEIQSEFEVSSSEGGVPPYIFNVTEKVEANRRLTVEVINVDQLGNETPKSTFGDFTVLRIGLRVVWAE